MAPHDPPAVDAVINWLSEEELRQIPTADYWNDEAEEAEKEYHVAGDGGRRLLAYLRDSDGLRQYESVLEWAGRLGRPVRGAVVDIAAGAGWTSALLSKVPAVQKVVCLEMSKHRLTKLAPGVFQVLQAEGAKILRVLGSFYNIRLPAGSVDCCFLSQAFHHADDPVRLLKEMHRVLGEQGTVLIIGENPVGNYAWAKQWAKNLVKMAAPASWYRRAPVRRAFPSFRELFPPDERLGDHFYRLEGYFRLFEAGGFAGRFRRIGKQGIFVLCKKSPGLGRGGNPGVFLAP